MPNKGSKSSRFPAPSSKNDDHPRVRERKGGEDEKRHEATSSNKLKADCIRNDGSKNHFKRNRNSRGGEIPDDNPEGPTSAKTARKNAGAYSSPSGPTVEGVGGFPYETTPNLDQRRAEGQMLPRSGHQGGEAMPSPGLREIDETNVYVAHLPPNMTENEFLSLVSNFGTVFSTRILEGDKWEKSGVRGVGFVRMTTKEGAAAVIAGLNELKLSGVGGLMHAKLAFKTRFPGATVKRPAPNMNYAASLYASSMAYSAYPYGYYPSFLSAGFSPYDYSLAGLSYGYYGGGGGAVGHDGVANLNYHSGVHGYGQGEK